MLTEQLISPIVPTLVPTDTGSKALHLMEENNLTQLPLIADDHYMALINENDILDWEEQEEPLSKADFIHYHPAVMASGHPYDAVRLAHSQNISVVPVIDGENKYLGAITRDELFNYISANSGLDNPGAIIVLEILPLNYTLYEIARIFENEDVQITSLQVRTINTNGLLEVTIKTNRTDLQAVSASLERHNYKVREVFGEVINEADMRNRFDLLMNYLNM